MIKKIQRKKDPFKEDIEKITKELKDKNTPKINEVKQRDYFEQIKESLPKLETEIREIIETLKYDISSCNALHILNYFGFLYSFSTPKALIQEIDSDKYFILDYIYSLVSAIGSLINKDCEEDILNKIIQNIKNLNQNSIFYSMLTSEHKGLPNQTNFIQTINYMMLRGDSYYIHKIEMCKELFYKFNDLLQNKYDITTEKLIDELVLVSKYPLKNFEIQKKYFNIKKLAYDNYKKKINSIKNKSEREDFVKNYKNSKDVENVNKKLQEIYDKTGISFQDSIFKIHKTLLPKEILDQISMQIGSNKCFQNGKIEYFPTNDTLIYNKPILEIDNDFFCFNPALMIFNLHTLLENIVLNAIPPKKHQRIYYKKKGEYLEDKSLELFQNILPACKIYKNLKYNKDDEVDGIVIYDNNIFIIEAKSNKFTEGAKKGNLGKIKRNTKDIIEKAYQQAIRAKKFILSEEEVYFRDKKTNKEVLTIKRNDINNIYLINTTLEALNHISTNLTSLKQFGFIQDDEWIWSVYINDLRIITEILDSPSEFLLYIDRRIHFNDYPQIRMAEEIDIFGYFLSEGLYFDDIKFPKDNFALVIDSAFSKNIDLYYLWKEGVLPKKQEKPSSMYKCKNNIKFLVYQLEKLHKENFTKLTTFLLNFDCYTQTIIKSEINNILESKRIDFHLYKKEKNTGIVFVAKRKYDYNLLKQQCELYAYERKINNWFVVIIENDFIDFVIFYYDNKPNKIIEEKLEELKQFRIKQTLFAQKKIGRNELCPCGSGKKYKKCCLGKKL